jgi:hypothetical protein
VSRNTVSDLSKLGFPWWCSVNGSSKLGYARYSSVSGSCGSNCDKKEMFEEIDVIIPYPNAVHILF